MKRRNKGFTLFEILIVLGIIAASAFVVLIISIPRLNVDKTREAAETIASHLAITQQNAHAGKNDKSYGIRFGLDSYDLFIGDSYATAESVDTVDVSGDAEITVVNLQSGNEMVFESNTLAPVNWGTVTVSDGDNSYTLEVNKAGFIDVY